MADPKPVPVAKVAATGIGGAIATLAVWAWNTKFPGLAQCDGLMPIAKASCPSQWHLGTVEVGAVVAIIAWAAGPGLRFIEKFSGRGDTDAISKAAAAGAREAIRQLEERGK